jgi:hypothetical protein
MIQESVANSRCRSVSMNDHSPSTGSCSSSGVLEPAATQIGADELSHKAALAPGADDPPAPPEGACFPCAGRRSALGAAGHVRLAGPANRCDAQMNAIQAGYAASQ